MGSYNGASTLVDHSWFGRSEEKVQITAIALVGPQSFESTDQFRRYCEMVERMRAYASNYEQSSRVPDVQDQLQSLIIDTLVAVSKIELGKDHTLFDKIKEQLGWPVQFVQAAMRGDFDQSPAMAF